VRAAEITTQLFQNPIGMNAKQAAAYKAVEAVQSGMTVGLGTGSTAYFAIERLGEMVRGGLQVQAVGSSVATEALAKKAGIEIVDFSAISSIDLYIDGADEVDIDFNLIKGGGGALVREKIVAFNSKTFVVIVDSSKRVQTLGKFPLPVEVVPFAITLTMQHLEYLGGKAVLRQKHGETFKSDNGNYIIDVHFNTITDPASLNAAINIIPGVVESGLFPGRMVHRLVVGYEDGRIEIIKH
jgi:ribose 5-phosphate isomerase A